MGELAQEWLAGTIMWFNYSKGFGIIRPDSNQIDDMRFETDILDLLGGDWFEGMRVEFLFEQKNIGVCITNIRIPFSDKSQPV